MRRHLLLVASLALCSAMTPSGPASAASPPRPETITAGYEHTCALDTAGKAWCWGSDIEERLGNGPDTGTRAFAPGRVVDDHTFTSITAGGYHTCALDTVGKAWCWGWDSSGQLGVGLMVDRRNQDAPTPVVGDHTFTSISAGAYHTCALDTVGKAWCWGASSYGQTGTGGRMPTRWPAAVAGERTFRTIDAGSYHTCALDTEGRAWCWGTDRYGQVGDGPASQEDKRTPVRTADDRRYDTISASRYHTCALDTEGEAWCWGIDDSGQLGNGPANNKRRFAPVRTADGHSYTAITTGWYHTCATDTSGQAWCWGSDSTGQLGNGSADQADQYWAAPAAGALLTAFAAGLRHTCGLDTSGTAWCWGSDAYGQVGDRFPDQADKYGPVRVAGNRTYLVPGSPPVIPAADNR